MTTRTTTRSHPHHGTRKPKRGTSTTHERRD
jgi:hypothetical protein